jgi:hypothetical protein
MPLELRGPDAEPLQMPRHRIAGMVADEQDRRVRQRLEDDAGRRLVVIQQSPQ